MKTEQEIISKLRAYGSSSSSWKEKARWRMSSKSWLRHSQKIAMLMLDRMEELGLNQQNIADKMGCSQQYISKILKGSENLSIETIDKIERALDIKIMA
ncbi:MAG: helix-turn-helix transcriptional regulator [Muribaculaceae bacterium]|nr:helix-turn-helix transcriptional regulator [Muribaculaceae bacterium]